MSDIVIKVENVSKIYKLYEKPVDRLKESLSITKKKYHREHYALNDVSFEIKRGETVGIIGKNGSGKSTILKIITGVLSQNKGDVFINGKISALLELGAGFNPEFTGIENIYLNGTMTGFTRDEMKNKINDIIEFADIGEFIYQPVKTYSSGMFARLAFAVAININPDILIVDEALSVGDVFFQAKCYKKFDEFKEKGKTILFVSHDLNSIIKYCSETILLNNGKMIAMGSSGKMVDLYKKILVNQFDKYGNEKSKEIINNNDIWKNKLELNTKMIEYGNGAAKIIDFAVIDNNGIISNNIIKGTEFIIKMKVAFFEDIEEPIYAFTIKDVKGTEISGTNTLIERVKTRNNKNVNIEVVSFKQKMMLQGYSYLLSLGCTMYKGDEFIVMNRLYDVCNINVISTKNTIGYYDMDTVVEIDN